MWGKVALLILLLLLLFPPRHLREGCFLMVVLNAALKDSSQQEEWVLGPASQARTGRLDKPCQACG